MTEISGDGGRVHDPLADGRASSLFTRPGQSTTTLLRLSNAEQLSFVRSARTKVTAWFSGDIVRAPSLVDLTLPATPQPIGASSSGNLVFPGNPGFVRGEVVTLGVTKWTPNGLVATVADAHFDGANTTVTYSPAGLLDAYKELNLVSQLPIGSGASGRSAHRDVTPINANVGKTFDLTTGDVPLSSAPAVSGRVGLSFRPSLTLVITIHTGLGGVPTGLKVYYAMDATTTASASLTAGGTWSGKKSFDLGTRTLAPIEVGPIVVIPELSATATLGASATAQATLTRSITEKAHIGLSAVGDIGSAPSIVGDTGNGFAKPTADLNSAPQTTVAASANAGLALDFTLALDGAAGPHATASAGLNFTVDPTADPWWRVDATGDFKIGLDLNALDLGPLAAALKLAHIPTQLNWTVGHLSYNVLRAPGALTQGTPVDGQAGTGQTGGQGQPSSTGSYPAIGPGPDGDGAQPPPGAAIQIAPSATYPGYVALTLTGFPAGVSYRYTCHFASGGDSSFVLTTTSTPQTFDNGHTCFDAINGDVVSVSIGNVTSNSFTVGAPAPQTTSQPATAYDNYSQDGLEGHSMCRGNPDNSASMPGGTVTQTFKVPGNVGTLDTAKVQIDGGPETTGHLVLSVNGTKAAEASTQANGDTVFTFPSVAVKQDDVVTLSISLTATGGKIATVYTVGSPGGNFQTTNTCPDGASNDSRSPTGLRAIVSGTT